MGKLVPTLTKAGWVEDPSAKATYILDYIVATSELQSNTYLRNVTSFPAILQRYGTDPDELISQLRQSIRSQFEKYYDAADVNVTHDATDDNVRYDIKIRVNLMEGGKQYNLGRQLTIHESKILKFTNY